MPQRTARGVGVRWLALTAVLTWGSALPLATRAEDHGAPPGPTGAPAATQHCEEGIAAARRGATPAAGPTGAPGSSRPASSAPDGMVWIPGGEFSMGSDEFPDALREQDLEEAIQRSRKGLEKAWQGAFT